MTKLHNNRQTECQRRCEHEYVGVDLLSPQLVAYSCEPELPFKARGHVVSIRISDPLSSKRPGKDPETEAQTSIEQIVVNRGTGNDFKHAVSILRRFLV